MVYSCRTWLLWGHKQLGAANDSSKKKKKSNSNWIVGDKGQKQNVQTTWRISSLQSPFHTFKMVTWWKCGTQMPPYYAPIHWGKKKKIVCWNLIDRKKLFLHCFCTLTANGILFKRKEKCMFYVKCYYLTYFKWVISEEKKKPLTSWVFQSKNIV